MPHLLLAAAALVTSSAAWALTAQVPEPGSLALFGVGIASAILVARYIKKK